MKECKARERWHTNIMAADYVTVPQRASENMCRAGMLALPRSTHHPMGQPARSTDSPAYRQVDHVA